MCEQVPVDTARAIQDTACFGHLWMDDYGVCPELHCDIRSYCQQVYQLGQVEIARDSERKRLKFNSPSLITEQKDPEKFVRRGYRDLNRDVDKLLKSFKNNLPLSFSFVKSTSYHLVKYRNNTIARFWTNAKHRAILDLVPDLTNRVTSECLTINRDKNHITSPVRVPESSVKKLHPCTHRITILTEEGSKVVAALIKSYYGV